MSIIAILKTKFRKQDVEEEHKTIDIRYDICLKDREKISGITSGYKNTGEFSDAIHKSIINNGTLTLPFENDNVTFLVNARSITCVKYQEVGSDESGKDRK